MPENEKRIVIRVDPETWLKWDDRRHRERVSFQQLGESLFQQWFRAVSEDVPKTEQGNRFLDSGNVIKCTHIDPVYPAIERILSSNQAKNLRAIVQYVAYYVATHLETLPADEQSRAIEDLAKAIEDELAATQLSSSEGAGTTGQSATISEDESPDRRRRTKAS